MNVVCVKWGRKYPPLYVERLEAMVRRRLSRPHRFVCLTDDPAGLTCETRPLLDPSLRGWWQKLTLFAPRVHDLEGPTLFLDLDLVIVGALDPFFDDDAGFRIIRDWESEHRPNSSVFRLTIGAHPHVWEQFDATTVTKRLQSDQQWIAEQLPDAPAWPNGWVISFKRHGGHPREDALPPDARIVAFNGSPKPHEAKAAWVREHWR